MLNDLANADLTDVIDKPLLDTKLDDYRKKTTDSCNADISNAGNSIFVSLNAAKTEVVDFVENWKTNALS